MGRCLQPAVSSDVWLGVESCTEFLASHHPQTSSQNNKLLIIYM